ncbi:MAG: hypothetical protein DRJ61_09915 [Acidobacteria bacterium]|nr:MAG: hypothetical protein DRJ61_09915 [Acidobacteriota bacterium]
MSNTSHDRRIRLAFWILVIAGLIFRIGGAVGDRSLIHDEPLSLMAATGPLGVIAHWKAHGNPPIATWVPAQQWQNLLVIEERWCLDRIRSDLLKYDIHPPLYFWSVHAWMCFFGSAAQTARFFNALIAVLIAVTLVGAGRLWGLRTGPSLLVAGAWFIGPSALAISHEIRHYELMGLWAVGLIVAQGLVFQTPDSRKRAVGLCLTYLTVLLGILTHYHFAIFAAGVAVWALCRRRPSTGHVGFLVGTAIGMGFISAWYVLGCPVELLDLGALPSSIDAVDVGQLEKLRRTFWAWGNIIVPFRVLTLWNGVLGWILGFGFIAFSVWLVKTRATQGPMQPLTFYFVWNVMWLTGLYLAGHSPGHAMGPKYLACAWPVLFLLMGLRFQDGGFEARRVIWVVLFVVVTGGFAKGSQDVYSRITARPPAEAPSNVVVDTLIRGEFGRMVSSLDPETRVFIAPKLWLFENYDVWRPAGNDDAVVFSSGRHQEDGSSWVDFGVVTGAVVESCSPSIQVVPGFLCWSVAAGNQ